MGWSESGGCMKHPYMKGSPGVCSSCLRDRLSQLSASNNMKTAMGAFYYNNNNNNNSFSHSPSASSSTYDEISPASGRRRHHHHHHHHRNVSEVMGSISFMLNVGSGLKKSRSMAFVAKPHDFAEVKTGKKKPGFWSKLLGTKQKGNKEDQLFMHSNTVRER